MMQAQIVPHWLGIFTAVIVSFFFGYLWHGPLFGKIWMDAMGMKPEDCKPDPKVLRKSMGLQLLATFLTAYFLTVAVEVWRPSVWSGGMNPAMDGPARSYAFSGALLVWLGFYVPMQLSKVAWERRPWKLFSISAAYDFLNLQIMAQIIEHWRR